MNVRDISNVNYTSEYSKVELMSLMDITFEKGVALYSDTFSEFYNFSTIISAYLSVFR